MYSFAIRLYAWVVSLIAPFHRKARLMRAGQRQTEGILRERIDRRARYIWFHAASLGEFEQGRPLMERIKATHPSYKILLTFFSPSGYEVRKNYKGADVVCYLPFDTPERVNRFLDLANPAVAIFIKYEFWGNYLRALRKRGVPTYIISSIFRRDQLFFQWYGYPYRKLLTCFTHLFVQDKKSVEVLAENGIHNVTETGDTRFDRVLDVCHEAKLLPLVERFVAGKEGTEKPAFVLVAGSSWPPDEAVFIPYFHAHPEMRLIIAPHEIHEEHLRGIEAMLKRPSIRYSQVKSADDLAGKDCLIIDCFGLLSSIYRYGQFAYIGGGFGVGIHNTLEAAVYGVPVFFGPNYKRFREAVDLVASKAGIEVKSAEDFQASMDGLLADPERLKAVSAAAANYVAGNAGATNIVMRQLEADGALV